jgi:hypothetical protein
MKKRLLSYLIFGILIINITFVLAGPCDLDVSIINQDPYLAIPGDYVKIVFQVQGVENPECGKIEFELLEKYPISFDPLENPKISTESGIYNKDYSSFLLVPYKIRVDSNALEGDNPIEVQYKFGLNLGYETKQFNLNVKDSKADFEIYISDYDSSTRTMTFKILNTEDVDVEALTIEIPKQNNIEIKGSNINIVGDLDSNEYTTADFEAIPKEGEITIKIIYTDEINKRRTIEKTVLYDSEYFTGRIADKNNKSLSSYLPWLIILGIIIYYFYIKRKKKQRARRR